MEEHRLARFQVLSGNGLKMIAIVTMLIDHIGEMAVELEILHNYDASTTMNTSEFFKWMQINTVLRTIGRLAFPIFYFLIVEGFLHTRDAKKYALRLLAFSSPSEIPLNLGLSGTVFSARHQDVYFTLFLGLLALIEFQKYQESLWERALVLMACCGVAVLFRVDYDVFGMLFIVFLYLLHGDKMMQTLLGCVSLYWEAAGVLAFIPINMYNGSRGKWNLKYLFYTFYPVHILVLWGIRAIWLE